jgi:hypothetical protein
MIDTPKQLDDDAKRILASANLHRIRGRWHAATEACMDALCIEPDNVSAHSLMGDIYADQGRLDDAIQWYCLALDLDSESVSDRQKLTKAIEDRKKELAEKPPRLDMKLVKRAFRDKREDPNRTHFWRSERPVRIAIFIAAVLCLSTVVAWPIITARKGKTISVDPSLKQINTDPIFLSPFTSDGAGAASSQGAALLPSDPADRTLLVKLRSDEELLGRGISCTDVTSDPRSSRTTITYVSNAVAGTAVSRGQVVRNGIKVAQASLAAAASPQPVAFTLRCLVSTEHGGVSLGYVGDINASDVLNIDAYDQTRSDAEMEAKFISVWWSTMIPATQAMRTSSTAAPQVIGPALPPSQPAVPGVTGSTPPTGQSPGASPTAAQGTGTPSGGASTLPTPVLASPRATVKP